jgi:hypothetical protein
MAVAFCWRGVAQGNASSKIAYAQVDGELDRSRHHRSPGMWRSVKVDGILSDTANLCWSKDNVMAQAIREVAWDAANDPRKCPVKRGSRQQKSPPMRLNAA